MNCLLVIYQIILNNNAQKALVFETQDAVDYVSEFDAFENGEINAIYGSMKLYNRIAYGQIGLRKYYKIHNVLLPKTTTTTIQFRGDCFITKFSLLSSAFTKDCDSGGDTSNSIHFE